MASKKANLPIKGMTCTSCAQTIEKNLKKRKGVHSANVNFASEKAYVDFDPQIISNKDLIGAVREVGYDVALKTEKLTLKIGGMTCASCAQTIEKALKKTEGILEANVNLATEQATIEFDAGVTNLRELEKVVEGTGYSVVKKEAEEKEEEKVDEDIIKVQKARRLRSNRAGKGGDKDG
ncbi:MAG: copper ion binding protein [Candidatus Hydrothermarchaeales archaeon]